MLFHLIFIINTFSIAIVKRNSCAITISFQGFIICFFSGSYSIIFGSTLHPSIYQYVQQEELLIDLITTCTVLSKQNTPLGVLFIIVADGLLLGVVLAIRYFGGGLSFGGSENKLGWQKIYFDSITYPMEIKNLSRCIGKLEKYYNRLQCYFYIYSFSFFSEQARNQIINDDIICGCLAVPFKYVRLCKYVGKLL